MAILEILLQKIVGEFCPTHSSGLEPVSMGVFPLPMHLHLGDKDDVSKQEEEPAVNPSKDIEVDSNVKPYE